jgi:hypothetical protein
MRLAPALVCSLIALAACGGPEDADRQAAIVAAEVAYEKAKAEGTDFSRGPCIADPLPILDGDWVADVAHDPRQDVDDEPENQCDSYRNGDSDHFVELDPEGNVIRAE